MQKSDSSVIKIIAVMNMVRGSIAAPLALYVRYGELKKVQRMSRERKTFHALEREPLPRDR
jgi:hypothetical protein